MGLRVDVVAVDSRDPVALAGWWGGVFGVAARSGDEHGGWAQVDPPGGPGLLFLPVAEPAPGKNRLHLDLVPDDAGQDAEVQRLLGLGATRLDVGQPADASWVVLADPEGNAFCVLRGAPTEVTEAVEAAGA